MKRTLLLVGAMIMATTLCIGQTNRNRPNAPVMNDEETLKALVQQWADAAVHADIPRLEKIADDTLKGNAQGVSFTKKMLHNAIKTGQLKVAAWTIEDVKVTIRGNSATVTGRSTLSNATYLGQDFSGNWEWTDRFVKTPDGTWRAVSTQAKIRK